MAAQDTVEIFTPLITNEAVVLGMLAPILGLVFWTSAQKAGFWSTFYGIVQALLLCYFLPSLLNSMQVINGRTSALYAMARDYLLPSALVLLCVAIDFKAIVRLGPTDFLAFIAIAISPRCRMRWNGVSIVRTQQSY